MKFIKIIFNFYINYSIHVALSVYALVRITELYFNLLHNKSLDYFIFYGTILGYNFVKYSDITKLHHKNLTKRLKSIQIFSLICFVLMCYYGWLLSFKTILFFIPFGILTVLYVVPFLDRFQKNLRNIGSIKIVVIALVWAGITVGLPIFNIENPIDTKVILTFFQRFLFVIVITLPFDIRDFPFDTSSLKTIPQLFEIEKTKKIGYFLLLLTLILEFIIATNSHFKNSFFIIFFIVLFLLMRAKTNQSKYYSSFWVEAIPIFWWGLLLLD